MEDQGRGRKEQEHVPGNWFSTWEEQLLVEADNDPSFEAQFNNYQRHTDQRLWISFQNTASSIAQLYKERLQDRDSGWIPFQTAAASATNLYKESAEASKTNRDLAIQCGYQRRNKELLAWVRKKKRNIRREDLISFLCGKSPPHRSSVSSRSSRPSSSASVSKTDVVTHDSDLQQFQEALSMQGLNGAMAGISVRSHPGSPNTRGHRASPNHSGVPPDLTNFIAEEFRRRRNNPSPPSTSATSATRGRSNSPSVPPTRKRHPSSESNSDCPSVSKKSRK
ncbi:HUWE1-associated protein modifying stress responses-like [Styela clava]